jgi:hypothetical protein
MNRTHLFAPILAMLALSSCTMLQNPVEASLRSTYVSGDLEVRLEGVFPGRTGSLKINDPVRARLSFKSLTGKPFRLWATPARADGGYANGGCYQPSAIITDREGILERFITACQFPNDSITGIRIRASSPEGNITIYEGVIGNVHYDFTN